MTRLITSWTCGSRAMALSLVRTLRTARTRRRGGRPRSRASARPERSGRPTPCRRASARRRTASARNSSRARPRVPRDQLRQLGLAQALGAGRALRQDQISQLGARVPDADLDALGQVDTELAQHLARLPHRAGPVLERLVPDRRQPDERVGITGAERADHEIVDAGLVLDDLEIDAAEAQLLDGRRPVGEEPLLVRRVDPGPGDDLGAVVRADVLLVSADDAIDGFARDELLFHEQRLERADAQREN